MQKRLKSLLRKSPALRKWFVWWYRHTNSTVLFSSARAVTVDTSFEAPDISGELWSEAAGWCKPIGVLPHVTVLWGEEIDFSGRRVALMAHWDKDGVIDPYVAHYARHLRDCGFDVVLASGGKATPDPEHKELFAAVLYRDCPGYDFTSWKAAFEALPSLHAAEELFVTNDSIFAPIGSFQPIFDAMRDVPCDFWGAVETHTVSPHLQSYMMLFRAKALRHPAFAEFFARVSASDSRKIALAHEQRLACWLALKGLSAGAWLPASSLPWPWFNPLHRTWKQMIRFGLPILKRDMFSGRDGLPYPRRWQTLTRECGYPSPLIRDFLSRRQAPDARRQERA